MSVPEIKLDPDPKDRKEEAVLDQFPQLVAVYEMRSPAFDPSAHAIRSFAHVSHFGGIIGEGKGKGIDLGQKGISIFHEINWSEH